MERYEQYGWIREKSPKELGIGNGWFAEIDTVLLDRDLKICVQIRMIDTEWGTMKHAAIRNSNETDIPWAVKQKIKDQIFGYQAAAVEVFPPKDELVDNANMYHLWILPEGFTLPPSFLHTALVKDNEYLPKSCSHIFLFEQIP
jgi:hypothetical protein